MSVSIWRGYCLYSMCSDNLSYRHSAIEFPSIKMHHNSLHIVVHLALYCLYLCSWYKSKQYEKGAIILQYNFNGNVILFNNKFLPFKQDWLSHLIMLFISPSLPHDLSVCFFWQFTSKNILLLPIILYKQWY